MKTDEKSATLDKLNALATDPLTVGGAATGLNLADMFVHFRNREEVLSVLQVRFPHALGELDRLDPQPWFDKIVALQRPQTYVSAYAGEAGEKAAITALDKLGIQAEQFSSRTHQANDLFDTDGIEYSVKSYTPEGASSFASLARRTEESDHYIVNDELYDRLQENGQLEALSERGISVLDGDFSHIENSDRAAEVVQRIRDQEDVSDSVLNDIPIVATIVGLASAGIVGNKYLTGKSSGQEAVVDLLGGAFRIVAGSGSAVAGSAAGAAVGSAVLPILGTIIGATLGGLAASAAAREIVRGTVEYAKWGLALEWFEQAAEQYRDGLPEVARSAVADTIYHRKELVEFLEAEEPRRVGYAAELDPNDPTPPTLAAVVWASAIDRARVALAKLDAATLRTSDSLLDLCVRYGVSRFPRQRESARRASLRLYGSFLTEIPVLRDALFQKHDPQLALVLAEIQESPNHPCRTDKPKTDILSAIALSALGQGA